ncbi:MAG: hypothetical protein DI586_02550 [Micavibrio aeruginosavorus]|uniref:Uncharacterized protein n=1 Tax=Micavibrio aeruginosavorus TaxID=349221 RepID=A0A2W5FPA3_9BACT|nr:MAG: hypothetical protein DI586_02550 [Micavibrio aeruginosavorus]
MSLFQRIFGSRAAPSSLDDELSEFNRLLLDLCTRSGDEKTESAFTDEVKNLSRRYGLSGLFESKAMQTLYMAEIISPEAAHLAVASFLDEEKFLKWSFAEKLAFLKLHLDNKNLKESFKNDLNISHALSRPKI